MTTVMFLSNKFSIVPNVKLIIFRCPKIWAHYSLIVMCSNIGTSKKIINFPFGTNGKLMVVGVPIFKHFRVPYFVQLMAQFNRDIININQFKMHQKSPALYILNSHLSSSYRILFLNILSDQ